ncbi:MAG TPA: peptidylprolyl isomerase [Terriglobales bacterium]|nr:peptidylprolyl isomerase [Terriglobales bacterium]
MTPNMILPRSVWTLFAACLVCSFTSCPSRPGGGEVMAVVDGRKILRADVDKYYPAQAAAAGQQPSGEQTTSLRLSILHELIDEEILMRRAEKLGLLATDEEVERKLGELKSPYTQDEFNRQLQEKKITLDDVKRDLRRSVTIDKLMIKEVTSKINISDQDITDYYNAHKAEFNLIEPQYRLAQIYVSVQPDDRVHNLQNSKAQNEAEARKKIQLILNRLDSGEDFAKLAMNFSEDPQTSANGGDLGPVPESGLHNTDPATRDAVLKLKPGQYSPIISTVNPNTTRPVGFRIVKLESKEPAGQRDLNDPRVQQMIRSQLRDRREQLLKSAYYEVLRDSAKVENYYAEDVLKDTGK